MKFKKYEYAKEVIGGMVFERIPAHDGSVLLSRRKEMKMTQQQVADAAGIQLRQYQRVEAGERTLSGSSARIMLSVCEVLQLDPYLFFGKGNEDVEERHIYDAYVVLPKIETNNLFYYIPQHAFYLMVSAIPHGMVCTEEEIWDLLKRVYHIDTVDAKLDYNSVTIYNEFAFPHWRLVSENGYITGSHYLTKDRQKQLLEDEGHNVKQVGTTQKYRIMDFNTTHFDVSKLKISVLETDTQIYERYKEYSDKIKGTNI